MPIVVVAVFVVVVAVAVTPRSETWNSRMGYRRCSLIVLLRFSCVCCFSDTNAPLDANSVLTFFFQFSVLC